MKRIFDLLFSFLGLVILSPFLLVIAILIVIDSKGDIFYLQQRVGKDNKDFNIFKFRTMRPNSDKQGLLTVGAKDSRITKIGVFLRKYKIDELPQLINVLIGNMSFVGPRPEVRKYVDLYNSEQKKVLTVKPGITDYASIEYSNENELLARSENPEKTYIEEIMPAKLELNLKYIKEASLLTDIKIIFKTFAKIVS
ncbi:MAG: sugar transferase [Bacteroidota bacterium]|jgi:lipopolysaccharide/colanic/teichoic acid biosynthesis glycosyltransferase|nr:sugar transferase [Bacteroidota bacterium]NLP19890.1 sugar transferase [Bacteroidales bacterium]OQC44725.1 MAG: UDP-N-acetylgalactosamine-undecaprenyl-phosphate N-acetylgalactosaminephosphotransferase [Bacteroidetes bacterium ADurb.Bin028]HNY45223.1 sugar transferase [Bacteroidales bacterium]HOD88172.1 sugar transferase [Bacteroidales bacterium]